MNDYDVRNRDPQKLAVYSADLCGNVEGETLSKEGTEAVLEALWTKHVQLPLRPPTLQFRKDIVDNHTYYAWKHEITFDASPESVPTAALIHEIAHAKLGAMGIGPFVESHGPIFLRVFANMWETYSARSSKDFVSRCSTSNLRVADEIPNLDGETWATVQEGGLQYAVRPAQRAVEIGWNVVNTFSTHVQDNHPMA